MKRQDKPRVLSVVPIAATAQPKPESSAVKDPHLPDHDLFLVIYLGHNKETGEWAFAPSSNEGWFMLTKGEFVFRTRKKAQRALFRFQRKAMKARARLLQHR